MRHRETPPERRDFVYWHQGFTLSQPFANREPTVTNGYPVCVCVWWYRHENGDGEAYTLLDQHVLIHEHENDDDKIYTLIWRCMHVVVLPCLSCTSWFNYVF